MSGLSAGKLRHRLVIERRVTTVDDDGQQSIAWVTFATVWAAVEPLSARELLTAQQVQSAVNTKITLRYLAGLLASMRFRHGPTVYNVSGVIPDNDSGLEWITVPCTSGINAG